MHAFLILLRNYRFWFIPLAGTSPLGPKRIILMYFCFSCRTFDLPEEIICSIMETWKYQISLHTSTYLYYLNFQPALLKRQFRSRMECRWLGHRTQASCGEASLFVRQILTEPWSFRCRTCGLCASRRLFPKLPLRLHPVLGTLDSKVLGSQAEKTSSDFIRHSPQDHFCRQNGGGDFSPQAERPSWCPPVQFGAHTSNLEVPQSGPTSDSVWVQKFYLFNKSVCVHTWQKPKQLPCCLGICPPPFLR